MNDHKAILKLNKKDKSLKGDLQKLGASLMLPLSLLAFASIFLGFTFIFPENWLFTQFLSKISTSIFSSFSILVFFSFIITFNNEKTNTTLIDATVFLLTLLIVQTVIVDTGIIPPFMVGTLGSYKEQSTHLFKSITPISLSLFSMIIYAIMFNWIDGWMKNQLLWPVYSIIASIVTTPIFIIIGYTVFLLGSLISLLPYGINAFLYGFVNRLLLPFGLHSLMIPTFTYSSVGGSMIIYDSLGNSIDTINGDSAIWIYMYTHNIQFQDLEGTFINNGIEYSYSILNNSSPGQYQVGFLPITSFAFPMIGTTYLIKNGWEKGKNIFIGSILTMFTGITELTEYQFIFTSPLLYFINALMVGTSFLFTSLLKVNVWISTGWIIDIILFGIIPSYHHFTNNWLYIPIVGVSIGIIYSLIFIVANKENIVYN